MALWQFDLYLGSLKKLKRMFDIIPEGMSEDELDQIIQFKKGFDEIKLNNLFKKYFSLSHESQFNKIWGISDSDCVIVSSEKEKKTFRIRLDLRKEKTQILKLIIDLCNLLDAIIIIGDQNRRKIVSPQIQNLIQEIKKSKSFSFVENPQIFLDFIRKK